MYILCRCLLVRSAHGNLVAQDIQRGAALVVVLDMVDIDDKPLVTAEEVLAQLLSQGGEAVISGVHSAVLALDLDSVGARFQKKDRIFGNPV